jgi:DNA-binding LytR/AlgR family response regulator
MNLRAYIVDDEEHASKIITSYIEMTEGLELAGSELDPLIALNKLVTREIQADITFLDIDMPKISGIELAGMIEKQTEVIFTTAFEEYAASAFEGNALDYLVKPISYIRFLKAINKVRSKLSLEKNAVRLDKDERNFFIKTYPNNRLINIAFDDIIYVESKHNYIEFFLNEVSYLAYLTLLEVNGKLPVDKFIRIHKSYIINLEMMSLIEGNTVKMTSGKEIMIGPNYRKSFQEIISEKLLKTKRS